MKEWIKLSIFLCTFGFLKEIRPSDSFLFEFLSGPTTNVTPEQVTQDILPVGTYSSLAQLVVVFLITDLCRYKPLIVVLGVSGIATWALFLWMKTLTGLQIAMALHGTFTATEVAYYTYIYAKVSKEYYQEVTSHTRAALLGGKSLSGVLAQILISFQVMSFRELNYITFSAIIAATLWTVVLPSVPNSIYFHQTDAQEEMTVKKKFKNAFSVMAKHFIETYTNKYVVRWSIWWILSTAGFLQVQAYIQALWFELGNYDPGLNGIVQTAVAIFGLLATLLAGVVKFNWRLIGNLVIVLVGIIFSGLVLGGSVTENLTSSYFCYVTLGALYQFMITVASSEIAKHISRDSHGLVFGFNTLLALIIQTFLTLIFVSGHLGPTLSVVRQYWVYGIYFVCISVIYIIMGCSSWFVSKKDIKKTYT